MLKGAMVEVRATGLARCYTHRRIAIQQVCLEYIGLFEYGWHPDYGQVGIYLGDDDYLSSPSKVVLFDGHIAAMIPQALKEIRSNDDR